MQFSSRYFSNTACEYFPCHDTPGNHNCLFCFCPLYHLDGDCGGEFTYTKNGVKDCGECTYPHRPQNYEAIMEKLSPPPTGALSGS